MSEENADLVRRIEKLEEQDAALRARLSVTHLAVLALFGALEYQTNDKEGLIRAQLLKGIRDSIDDTTLIPAAREAALDALGSFNRATQE